MIEQDSFVLNPLQVSLGFLPDRRALRTAYG